MHSASSSANVTRRPSGSISAVARGCSRARAVKVAAKFASLGMVAQKRSHQRDDLLGSLVYHPMRGVLERVHLGAGNALPPSVEKPAVEHADRKSTRLNSSHQLISYAVFCL